MKDEVVKRFLHYVSHDTQSVYNSKKSPSTEKQLILAEKLFEELGEMGIIERHFSEKGYVYAKLPSNCENPCMSIGFIAHIDTSEDCSGKDVKPNIIEKYNGGVIPLSKEVELSPVKFPVLKNYMGEDLIVAGGDTLLGADDKAGIAEIMTALNYLMQNKEFLHGDIWVAFTPDEEVGRGMDNFDLSLFSPDFAFTVDGGQVGELEFESFNAARAFVKIKGMSVHPGYAKNVMKNAVLIGTEWISLLPEHERPQSTEGYEGYYHVADFNGRVEQAEVTVLIRDFEKCNFEQRKKFLLECVQKINNTYDNVLDIEIKDEYFNMAEVIKEHMHIIESVKDIMIKEGVEPLMRPIRGGTDGSRLSFMGIPCPNIFAGGHNFHGPYEFIPVFAMKKAVRVIIGIAEFTSKSK